jgi:hypothetical protein
MRPSFGVPKLSKSKVACDTLNGRDFVWNGVQSRFFIVFMKNLL